MGWESLNSGLLSHSCWTRYPLLLLRSSSTASFRCTGGLGGILLLLCFAVPDSSTWFLKGHGPTFNSSAQLDAEQGQRKAASEVEYGRYTYHEPPPLRPLSLPSKRTSNISPQSKPSLTLSRHSSGAAARMHLASRASKPPSPRHRQQFPALHFDQRPRR